MQYSPKLKKAMEKIKEVLDKYDIAALVCLHTPGFHEYLNKVNPKYSALSFKGDGESFEIKGHSKHYFGNKEMRDQKLSDTKNMIEHFCTFAGSEFLMYDEINKKMEETYGKWDSTDDGHTSHSQQNN